MNVRTVLLAAALTAFAGSAFAAAPATAGSTAAAPAASEVELIPRSALFGNPERSNAQLSPDGRYLSWLAPLRGVMNVWVAPADEPAQARAVTDDAARGIRNYVWSYRSGTLLYLRDSGGDENFHLYAVDVARPGAARDLTAYPTTRAHLVRLAHRHPERILAGMNDRDAKWHDLYEVDLASGARKLVLENKDRLSGYLADGDLKIGRATRTREDGNGELLAADGRGGASAAAAPGPRAPRCAAPAAGSPRSHPARFAAAAWPLALQHARCRWAGGYSRPPAAVMLNRQRPNGG